MASGQYVTLAVSFNPSATGNASGMVSLSSNASSSPTNISLSGVGVSATHWVTMEWIASTSVVVGYNIYCISDSGVSWTKLNSSPTPTTSYTDWDAQSGESYLFAVTAVDAANGESVFSNQVPAVIPSP